MVPVLVASVIFMLIAFASFSVRILFVKNGKFKGTCASNNPFMQKQGATCGVCGRKPDEECGNPELAKA